MEKKKSLNDEELTEVSGGIDVSSKKSIGYITVLVDKLNFNYEPIVGEYDRSLGLKGETYQIYAIKQNDGKKWFLLDNGLYVAYDPTKMSLVFTF